MTPDPYPHPTEGDPLCIFVPPLPQWEMETGTCNLLFIPFTFGTGGGEDDDDDEAWIENLIVHLLRPYPLAPDLT